jgi:hypothetical protein
LALEKLGSGAGDEVRLRDERRVRPRVAEEDERAAWEAMAKANSRLRPARTPERSTKELAAPSGSSSMVDPSAVVILNSFGKNRIGSREHGSS